MAEAPVSGTRTDEAGPAIRPARPDELDAIAAMWGAMYAYQQAQGMLLPLRDDAIEIWKRENATRLDTALATVLVAEWPTAATRARASGAAPTSAAAASTGTADGYVGAHQAGPSARVGANPSAPPLAGFLAAQTKRLPPFLAAGNPKIGYISAVYVDPAARRHHLGRALVDAALAWFTRAEVSSIELQVIATNDLARAFWQSVGFQPEILQMRRL